MYQTPFQTFYVQAYLSSQQHKMVSVINPTFFPWGHWGPAWFIICPNIHKWLGASLEPQLQLSSVTVVSDSLWPHESQHARPPCPSPTPRVHSASRLSSQWCHPAISSSVVPFSSCPLSLPASESFPMNRLFAWGGQSICLDISKAQVLSLVLGDSQCW